LYISKRSGRLGANETSNPQGQSVDINGAGQVRRQGGDAAARIGRCYGSSDMQTFMF